MMVLPSSNSFMILHNHIYVNIEIIQLSWYDSVSLVETDRYKMTPITKFVRSETWNNVNRIAKSKKLTVLYRDFFDDHMIVVAKKELKQSWSDVNIESLGDDTEQVLLINLKQ